MTKTVSFSPIRRISYKFGLKSSESLSLCYQCGKFDSPILVLRTLKYERILFRDEMIKEEILQHE